MEGQSQMCVGDDQDLLYLILVLMKWNDTFRIRFYIMLVLILFVVEIIVFYTCNRVLRAVFSLSGT